MLVFTGFSESLLIYCSSLCCGRVVLSDDVPPLFAGRGGGVGEGVGIKIRIQLWFGQTATFVGYLAWFTLVKVRGRLGTVASKSASKGQ